jgi:hypothetical protein
MLKIIRRKITNPMFTLGAGVLWGVTEFVALQRAAVNRSKTR